VGFGQLICREDCPLRGVHSGGSPLEPNEAQVACLQGLANGEKHADLAKRLGYSERHLQRILADMWHQFGVDSTTEGGAFAVAQGWITVSRNME